MARTDEPIPEESRRAVHEHRRTASVRRRFARLVASVYAIALIAAATLFVVGDEQAAWGLAMILGLFGCLAEVTWAVLL